MNDYLQLLDQLEAEFKARISEVRALVSSERFANLSPDEKSALFAIKLNNAFEDSGGAA